MSHDTLRAGATRVLRRGATRVWRRVRTGTTIGSFAMLALAACTLWLPAEGTSPPHRGAAGRGPALLLSAEDAPAPHEEGLDRSYAALRRLFPADWETPQRGAYGRDSGDR